MANEVFVSLEVKFDKGDVHIHEKRFFFDTVTGTNALANTQTVGFAVEEAIVLGDVAAGGLVLAINTDPTNYVTLREQTGADEFIRIKPGQFSFFRLDDAATAPFAIANTGNVDMIFILIDA